MQKEMKPWSVSVLLLWSEAEQGPTQSQDRLFGSEGILSHLQSVWPMRWQLADACGRVLLIFLQLSECVLQLTKHVQPKHNHKLHLQQHYELLTLKVWAQTWRCTRILSGRFHIHNWQQTEGRPAPSSPASASHRNSWPPASWPTAAAGRAARPMCLTAGLQVGWV